MNARLTRARVMYIGTREGPTPWMEGSGRHWVMKCIGQTGDHSKMPASSLFMQQVHHHYVQLEPKTRDQNKKIDHYGSNTVLHTCLDTLIQFSPQWDWSSHLGQMRKQRHEKVNHLTKLSSYKTAVKLGLNSGFVPSSLMFPPTTCCFYIATNVKKAQ